MGDPELTSQAISALDPGSEALLLFPVRLRQVLAALDDQGRAFPALAHAAAIQKVRIRKLPYAGPDDEIGVLLDLALKDLAIPVKNHVRHSASLRSWRRSSLQQ